MYYCDAIVFDCHFFLQLKEKMKSTRRMTIPEIKSTLSIQTVLASYGLTPGKGNSIKCPFHADGKASMKIYPATNTAFCFAGSCDVKKRRRDRFYHENGKRHQARSHPESQRPDQPTNIHPGANIRCTQASTPRRKSHPHHQPGGDKKAHRRQSLLRGSGIKELERLGHRL